MTAAQLFSFSNLVAMAGWILLIFAGRRRGMATLVPGVAIPILLAAIYSALIVLRFPDAEGGFNSIASVRALFADDWLLLAGWVHYLAFDLFIGSWQVRDAQARGIPHLAVVPCLILTFLFGPAGLLAYTSIRAWRTRTMAINS